MNKLTELANKYAADKGTEVPNDGKFHGPRLGFTEVYYEYFKKIKDEPISILEIGVGAGNSLKMWYDFFPNAKIYAIDIVNSSKYDNDKVKTFIIDQSNRDSLLKFMEQIDKLDIIIDDGSHVCEHQQISLGVLFKCLKSGGQYWIEDLHTSDTSVWVPGKKLYGYEMGNNTGNKNTVNIIESFINNKVFDSGFLTKEENKFLTQEIEECKMFQLDKTFYGENKLAYFKRK